MKTQIFTTAITEGIKGIVSLKYPYSRQTGNSATDALPLRYCCGKGEGILTTDESPMNHIRITCDFLSPLRRLAALLALVLCVGIGQVWGDNYTETYSNPTGSNSPAGANGLGAFSVIGSVTGNVSFGNSALQIGSNGGNGTFTVSSMDGSYIGSINFTETGNDYVAYTFTSTDGTLSLSNKVWTFTPNTKTKTSCSFSLSAPSNKKTRLAPIVVNLTSDYEYFTKNFSVSSGTVSCTKSNASTDVTITTSGSASSNYLAVNNGKTLTLASSGHNIKSIHFIFKNHDPVTYTASTGTYSSNSWTADTDTKTVTFSSSTSTNIAGISIELEEVSAASTWYVKGGWNSWGTTDNLTGSGTTLTKTVNITTAGLYEFKIFDSSGGGDGTWYGNGGNIGCNVSGWVFATNAGNCKFFASETGNYTFSFNTSTKALSVTYPTAQNKFYYKNTSSWSSVAVYRYVGSINNGWPGTIVAETETICGDTYYFTYADPATTIIFNNNDNGGQHAW